HDKQVKRISEYFKVPSDFYKTVEADNILMHKSSESDNSDLGEPLVDAVTPSFFHKRNLSGFKSHIEAYHQLVADLIAQQKISSEMVLKGADVTDIYVDGGFCKNSLYMKLIADAFP